MSHYVEDVFALKAEADHLRALNIMLLAALREIETICAEDNAACRRRMGTRVGNALVAARAAIARATA